MISVKILGLQFLPYIARLSKKSDFYIFLKFVYNNIKCLKSSNFLFRVFRQSQQVYATCTNKKSRAIS